MLLAIAIFIATITLVIWQPRGLGIGWSAIGGALLARRAAGSGGCDRAFEYAVMTAPEARDTALIAKLEAVAGRVLSP